MTEAVTGDVDGIELKPPMSERFRFNARDFPYWLVAILGILVWMLVLIVTNDQYREAWHAIIPGLTTTISATIYGFALATVIGLLAGLGRISKNVVARNVAITYIEFIRGVPILVLLFTTAYVIVPQLSSAFGFSNSSVSNFPRAVFALALIYGAYLAEVFRAGIESVPKGQTEAGRSLGLSHGQTMRRIVLPQAIRNMTPALGNDLIAMLKDSSLLSVLAIREITQEARLYASSTFQFRPDLPGADVPLPEHDARPVAAPAVVPEPARAGRVAMTDVGAAPMVQIDALVKTFDRGRVVAVDGVDLTVPTGGVTVLVGPSGSGKSTVLRCINGLELPTSGSVHVDGRLLTPKSSDLDAIREEVGMVFQQFNLFAHLTALENITLAQRVVRKRTKAVAESTAREQLAPRRHPREGRQLPTRAERRPAAARRHRAVAGHGPEADALRRADERARPGDDQRGARRDAGARAGRDDDGGRHPRDGLRPRRRPTRSW